MQRPAPAHHRHVCALNFKNNIETESAKNEFENKAKNGTQLGPDDVDW